MKKPNKIAAIVVSFFTVAGIVFFSRQESEKKNCSDLRPRLGRILLELAQQLSRDTAASTAIGL